MPYSLKIHEEELKNKVAVDMLVPQDVRERKGSYFTPQQWVELSQKYLADVLGQDWQDEYTVWDCAAGTGNLLAGLINKRKLWASTIDQADVDVMKDRIANGANLFESHVFQFDFLNDDFSKCPEELQKILNDPEKRKKLLVYINPPYAEAASKRTVSTGENNNKKDVAVQTAIYAKYKEIIGIAARELFAQFLIRIHEELRGCHIGQFSKLKHLQASNFAKFRTVFGATLKKIFLVPADSFDNVTGKFPIGFFIWETGTAAPTNRRRKVSANVYTALGKKQGRKSLYIDDKSKTINDWLIQTRDYPAKLKLGFISCKGTDFQNKNYIFILNSKDQLPAPRGTWITDANLREVAIYLPVRHVIKATWLNDRDQFYYPKKTWQEDTAFQTDCLAWTLFNTTISVEQGINHWIPFTEDEVGAEYDFASHFMTDYMSGKLGKKAAKESKATLVPLHSSLPSVPLEFSEAAKAVFAAGRELWKYYHAQSGANVNAALYDIKRHFQGVGANGRMRSSSDDAEYTVHMDALREALATLAAQIAPKVYEHGFLRE